MIKWLFGVAPEVGSTWKLHERDPFRTAIFVKVLDVKQGYVEYLAVGEGFVHENLSASVRQFRELYKEL